MNFLFLLTVKQIIKDWSADAHTSLSYKGVEVDEDRGKIQIIEHGTYFVYCHLSFGSREPPTGEPLVFESSIERWNLHHANPSQSLFEDSQVIRLVSSCSLASLREKQFKGQ